MPYPIANRIGVSLEKFSAKVSEYIFVFLKVVLNVFSKAYVVKRFTTIFGIFETSLDGFTPPSLDL